MLFPKMWRTSKPKKDEGPASPKIMSTASQIHSEAASSANSAVTKLIIQKLEDTLGQFPDQALWIETHFLDFIRHIKNKLAQNRANKQCQGCQEFPLPLLYQQISQIHESLQETFHQARQNIEGQLIEQNRQLTKENLKLRCQIDERSIERQKLESRCKEAETKCSELEQTLENIQEVRSAGSQKLFINVENNDGEDLPDKGIFSPRTTLASSPRFFSSRYPRNFNDLLSVRSQDSCRRMINQDAVTLSTQTLPSLDNPETINKPRRRILVRRRN